MSVVVPGDVGSTGVQRAPNLRRTAVSSRSSMTNTTRPAACSRGDFDKV